VEAKHERSSHGDSESCEEARNPDFPAAMLSLHATSGDCTNIARLVGSLDAGMTAGETPIGRPSMFKRFVLVVSLSVVVLVLFGWLGADVEVEVEAQAPLGVAGYRKLDRSSITSFDGEFGQERPCLQDQRVLGGGCFTSDLNLKLVNTYPSTEEGSGLPVWRCEWTGTAKDARMVTYALCADR
jgi:hypothetical protein